MRKVRVTAPGPGKCRICAVGHDAREPHSRDSLYYMYRFRRENGRFPTWEDAMAHCDAETKARWRRALTETGAWDGANGERDQKTGGHGGASTG